MRQYKPTMKNGKLEFVELEPSMTPIPPIPEDALNIVAAELHTAWRKYSDSFGEPPHGSLKQLRALLCFTTIPQRIAKLAAEVERLQTTLNEDQYIAEANIDLHARLRVLEDENLRLKAQGNGLDALINVCDAIKDGQ